MNGSRDKKFLHSHKNQPVQPDDTVERGEECGTLESVKAASEVYSPVSGKSNNLKISEACCFLSGIPNGIIELLSDGICLTNKDPIGVVRWNSLINVRQIHIFFN